MNIEILRILQANALSSTWHLPNNLYILVAVSTINITECLVDIKPGGIVFAFYELAAY